MSKFQKDIYDLLVTQREVLKSEFDKQMKEADMNSEIVVALYQLGNVVANMNIRIMEMEF